MALRIRETKEQKTIRLALEAKAAEQVTYAASEQSVMTMLERACKVNFELTVVDGVFVLYDRDSRDHIKYQLFPKVMYRDDLWENENTTIAIEQKEADIRAAKALETMRKAALAKLTDAERKVLGV